MSQKAQENAQYFTDDLGYDELIKKCRNKEIDFEKLTGGLSVEEFLNIAAHFNIIIPKSKTHSLSMRAALLSYIICRQENLSDEVYGKKFSSPIKKVSSKANKDRGNKFKKLCEAACDALIANVALSEDLKAKLKKAIHYVDKVTQKSSNHSLSETDSDPFTPKNSSTSFQEQPTLGPNSSQFPDNTPLIPRKLDETFDDSVQRNTNVIRTSASTIRPNLSSNDTSSFKLTTISLNPNLASGFYGATRAILDTPQLDANAKQAYIFNTLSFFCDKTKVIKKSSDNEDVIDQSNNQDLSSKVDGNCAYNALVLALGTLVSDLEDKLPASIKHKLMTFFSIYFDEYDVFSDVINYFKKHSPSEWQNYLSVKLRKTTVFLLSSDERYMLDYFDLLYDVFTGVISRADDDTFFVHKFIENKFNDIKDLPNTEKHLFDWWSHEGWQLYLDEIRKPASSTFDYARWGGGQELAILAEYFSIGIDINRNKGHTESLQSHVLLPRKLYSKEQLLKLNDRGVVDVKNGRHYLCWKMRNGKEIEDTNADLLRLKGQLEVLRGSFSQVDDDEWILSEDSVQGLGSDIHQLYQRGVVTKTGVDFKNYKLIKDVVNDEAKLIARLDKIEVNALLTVLEKSPKIIVKLKFNGGHWDFDSYKSGEQGHGTLEESKIVIEKSSQQKQPLTETENLGSSSTEEVIKNEF